MNTQSLRRENDLSALAALNKFGWLRATELGFWLWPNTRYQGQAQACRAANSWVARGLMLARKLPGQSGNAYVLAAAGVEMLAEVGVSSISGKDFGSMETGHWQPPASWKHDLMAAGLLVRVRAHTGADVIPDFEIRKSGGNPAKIPDGLIVYPGRRVAWVEVENARKTGKRGLKPLAVALGRAANGKIDAICGHYATEAVLVFDENSDTDHRASVTKAIERETKESVRLTWVSCATSRAGVVGCTETVETLYPDDAAKILQVMVASLASAKQVQKIPYGEYRVEIRPEARARNAKQTYSVHINEKELATGITSDKRGLARASLEVASLTRQKRVKLAQEKRLAQFGI